MFCQILFFLDYPNTNTLKKYIQTSSKNFTIITNNLLLRENLQKEEFQVRDLNEFFPENDPRLWKINEICKSKLLQLKNHFTDLNYQNCNLFITLENQILNELILIQKTAEILQNQDDNIIFIFEGYSYSYFEILKLAKKLDYSIEMQVYQIKEEKIISLLASDKSLSKINIGIKISQLFNIQKSSTFKFPNNNLKEKQKLMLNFNNKKFFNIIRSGFKIYVYKYFPFYKNSKNQIINSSLNKAISLYSINETKCVFCFTLKRMDVLNGILPVIKQVENYITPFIFTFDYFSSNLLKQKNINFVDFTDEVLSLAKILPRFQEVKLIANKFQEISKKQSDVPLLAYDGFIKQMLNELFKVISIISICKKIFENFQFRSIVISDDVTRNGNTVISIAKKFNIISYIIPVLLIDANPIGRMFYHADKICIYGNQGLNSLLELGYSREKIIVTGNPKYDNLTKLTQKESKQILEKNYGIKSDRCLIAIAMSRWHKNDEKWLVDFIKFCSNNNFELVIKLHPMYQRIFKDYSTEKINYIKLKCKNENYLINFDMDLSILLSASNILITDYSNTGVEAVLLKKPLITVNFSHENLQNQQKFYEQGASIHLENYKDLEIHIKQIFSSTSIHDFKLGYNKIVSNYNYNNDGKSSERISKILLS